MEEGGPLGRPRRRWKYNGKIDLKEIGWEGLHWVQPAPDRLVVGSYEHGNERLGFIECWLFLEQLGNH
jgi:hypothetical protein